MTEELLRARVSRDCGRRDLPDTIWARLVRKEFVKDVLRVSDREDRDAAYRNIVEEARDLLDNGYGGGQPVLPPDHSADKRYPVALLALTEAEEQRALVVSEIQTYRAGRQPSVAEWRRRVLANRLLTQAEARDFLRSPATAVLTVEDFERHGIPVLGHHSEIVEEGVSADGAFRVRLRVTPPGGEIEKVFADVAGKPQVWVPFAVRFEKPDAYDTLPGSVTDQLRLIGVELAELYLWEQEDAVRFVLTGEAPTWPAITGWVERRDGIEYTQGMIGLEVEPWVSVETVSAAYRRLQEMMFRPEVRRRRQEAWKQRREGKRKRQRWHNAPLDAASMVVVWFYEWIRWEAGSRTLSHAEVADIWNIQCRQGNWGGPERAFKNKYKFKPLYDRTSRRLLRPDYWPDKAAGAQRWRYWPLHYAKRVRLPAAPSSPLPQTVPQNRRRMVDDRGR